MYKVVIIDDEPVIALGLTKLLPWAKYDCEVIGTAENGEDGLELIRRVRPDIVYSDIYMPKMNGLLMAAALRSEFEDTEITILTGYRDFDYLQEALKLGVTRYVLKPSNMKELEEALVVMTEKLNKKGKKRAAEEVSKKMASEGKESILSGTTNEETEASGAAAQVEGGEDTAAGSFIVRKAVEYIRENSARKLTLSEVADQVYVSQWHLSKLLNRHEGKSFLELVNEVRIEKAKELLKDPALRVGDIAEMIGFADIAHFSRVFKKVVGVSANEYRNRVG